MEIVYVNIGSNIGSRKELIEQAINSISNQFGIYCLSQFVESEPWGFDSTNLFLNIGMAFRTSLEPEDLLQSLKKIEKEISGGSHRDNEGNYCDREIDIDIMAIGATAYKSENLEVPHPHFFEREFFIKPMKELCPDWKFFY